MVWKAAFPPASFHGPRGVFCVGLQVSGGAVSGHQVVFFTLSVLLTTLSYRRSQTWQLGALWPSSQLENGTLWLFQQQQSDKHTHTHAHTDMQKHTHIYFKAKDINMLKNISHSRLKFNLMKNIHIMSQL